MSYSVFVTPTGDLPEVNERVASFCLAPGNILTAVTELGFEKNLAYLDRQDSEIALRTLLKELDKGDTGIFNNAWCVRADMAWSDGKESREDYDKFIPICLGKTYEEWTGQQQRRRLRDDAERFFLYFKSGYDVKFVW